MAATIRKIWSVAAGLGVRAGTGAGRWLWNNLILVAYLVLGFFLAGLSPGYNHVFAAYLTISLAVFGLKLWFGSYSSLSLVAAFTHLGICVSMLATGHADAVPYFGIVLCLAMAAVALARLIVAGPLPFRAPERVAENYLDAGLGIVVMAAAGALGWLWMPQIRYITVPILLLLGFKLSSPLRRRVYPWILHAFGWAPTDGPAPRPAKELTPGFSAGKGVAILASAAVVALVAVPLLATPERYDVSMPLHYSVPAAMTEERRAALERHLQTAAGQDDVEAMVELGALLHRAGLAQKSYMQPARAVLERALELEPENPRALAVSGSNEAAFAIYEWRPVKRFQLIERGKEKTDRAVALAPEDPAVRLSRVDVCLGVPKMFRLRPIAEEDLGTLLEWGRTRPAEMAEFLPHVYRRVGDLRREQGKIDEARAYWRQAAASFPGNSHERQVIAALLAGSHPLEAVHPATEKQGSG